MVTRGVNVIRFGPQFGVWNNVPTALGEYVGFWGSEETTKRLTSIFLSITRSHDDEQNRPEGR